MHQVDHMGIPWDRLQRNKSIIVKNTAGIGVQLAHDYGFGVMVIHSM
jgi:hypothetical protein